MHANYEIVYDSDEESKQDGSEVKRSITKPIKDGHVYLKR